MKIYKRKFKESNDLSLSSFYSEYSTQIQSTETYSDFVKVNNRLINLSLKKMKDIMNTIIDKKEKEQYYDENIKEFKNELIRVWNRLKK